MSSSTETSLSAEDICSLCGTFRDLHGDSNHEFSLDGELIPKKPGPAPRRAAPQERKPASLSAAASQLASDMTAQLLLRMIERLTARGIFTGEDLVYIIGGESAASTGGAPGEGAREDSETTSPE